MLQYYADISLKNQMQCLKCREVDLCLELWLDGTSSTIPHNWQTNQIFDSTEEIWKIKAKNLLNIWNKSNLNICNNLIIQ